MQDEKSRNNSGKAVEEEEEDSKIFPQKLMEILSQEEHSEAICWLPHGKAFVIRNRTLFAEQIMPKFFSRKAKYSSFTRKLNRWNFVRVSSGPELGAYYNADFVRDKPHLAAQMFCKNARSKLAMANENQNIAVPQPAPSTTAVVNPDANLVVPSSAQSSPQPPPKPMTPVSSASATIPPAVLAALQKEGKDEGTTGGAGVYAGMFNKAAAPILGVSNLQLLERQYQLMQEEHAQRMLLQQLAAKQRMEQQLQQRKFMQQHQQRLQQQQQTQQQQPQGPPVQQQQQLQQQQEQANAQAFMRMRQLMELRARQRKGLVPTNGRASAA